MGFHEVRVLALIDALALLLHQLVGLEQVVLLLVKILVFQDELGNGHPVTKALVLLGHRQPFGSKMLGS